MPNKVAAVIIDAAKNRDGTELPAAVFRNGGGFTERHYESGAAYLRVVFDSKVKAGETRSSY